MTARALALDPCVYAAVGASAVVIAFVFGGSKAGAGMALGVGGAAFNLIALWFILGQLGSTVSEHGIGMPPIEEEAEEEDDPEARIELTPVEQQAIKVSKLGTAIIVIAFFLKLPLYMLLGYFAQRIGTPAPGCFLGGVGLVYFALVGWALAKS